MGIFDRFKKKDTAAAAQAAAKEPAAPAEEKSIEEINLEQVREKSLRSARRLVDALSGCIADLSGLEKLSNEDRENITLQLQTMQKVLEGQHSDRDIEKLDDSLLTAVEKSLHDMIVYGRKQEWENALQTIGAGFDSRIRDEKAVQLAMISLSILALEALNCFLTYSNVTIRAQNNTANAELKQFCAENGIVDIDAVSDPDQMFELQHWYDEIESNKLLMKQNQDQQSLNKNDIRNLLQAQLLIEGKSHAMKEEDLKRVREIIASGTDLLLKQHNDIISRKEKAAAEVAHKDAIRRKIFEENAEVAPVLDEGQRQSLSNILAEEQKLTENSVQTITE